MTGFIVDCPVTVAWRFEDEATVELDSLLDRVLREGAVVPPLWISEAANVPLLAQGRGRIDRETMQERLALASSDVALRRGVAMVPAEQQ